uniref:Taste receptor type 2 n=1 Tax=Erpetoichthys calabaricus TaxID=27687 RepID=A0A8C4S0T8_ERPCA
THHRLVFSLILSSVQGHVGQIANVLVTGIAACSFVIGVCAFLWQIFLFFFHFCPVFNYETKILLTFWMLVYNIEFWLITCLCIFYCLMVVNFKAMVFVKAKQSILSVLRCFLLFGSLLSISETVLYTRITSVAGNDTFIPMSSNFSCPPILISKPEQYASFMIICLKFLMTTSLMFFSCGLLIHHLCSHVKQLEKSSFGLSSSSQEKLTRITKMIMALAVEFLISTVSSNFPFFMGHYTETSMVCLSVVYNLLCLMVPTTLIHGILILRQKLAAALSMVKTLCFKPCGCGFKSHY